MGESNDDFSKKLIGWKKKWAVQADYDPEGLSLRLGGMRGGTKDLGRVPGFDSVRQLHLVEASLTEDWFQLLNSHKHITSLSLESVLLPPGCQLPAHVREIAFRRVPSESIAELLESNLANLTHLGLKELDFTNALYIVVQQLNALTQLDLESTWPPGALGDKLLLTHLRLSQLTLNPEFVDWVKALRGLTHIEFAGTRFYELEPDFFKDARTLIIGRSEFKVLPEYTGNTLERLSLTYLPLAKIPASFMQPTLKSLELRGTEITELPVGIEKLDKIEELSVAQCRVKRLPGHMACVKRLRKLDLASLPIENLPAWLGEASSLEYLSLCGCRLSDIPEEIALPLVNRMTVKDEWGRWEAPSKDNPGSKTLYVKDLMIRSFDPRFLVSNIADQLLLYYYRAQKKVAHETTLFVLGASEHLRKQAIRALLEEGVLDEGHRGHGMIALDVGSPELAFGGEYYHSIEKTIKRLPGDLRLHIQEVVDGAAYNVAHPAFFLDSCIYLVLLDEENSTSISTQATSFAYMIEQSAPNAALVFCVVEGGRGPEAKGQSPGEGTGAITFPGEQLLASLGVSLPSDSCVVRMESPGMDDEEFEKSQRVLSGTVFSMIERLPIMEWHFPIAWSNIRREMEAQFKAFSHISRERFMEICKRYLMGELKQLSTGTDAIGRDFLLALLRWLNESGVTFISDEGTRHDQANVFHAGWVRQCVYGVLQYARREYGLTSIARIEEAADNKSDKDAEELLETRFLQHAQPLLGMLQESGLCVDLESNSNDFFAGRQLLFPLFRSLLATNPYSPSLLGPDQIRDWLASATAPTKITTRHYVIDFSVLTQGFYSAFLATVYRNYQSTLEAWGIASLPEACWAVGWEGGLFAFPPKDIGGTRPELRSGSLLVLGSPGSPARMHIYASGAACPVFPPHWQRARSHNVLAYATVALDAFWGTLRKHPSLKGTERHTVYFEETLGDDSALIPLEDIKAYRDAGRADYYCAPLRKTFDVGRTFLTTYPNPHSGK